MTSPIITPFTNQPISTTPRTSSYTIPSNRYARVILFRNNEEPIAPAYAAQSAQNGNNTNTMPDSSAFFRLNSVNVRLCNFMVEATAWKFGSNVASQKVMLPRIPHGVKLHSHIFYNLSFPNNANTFFVGPIFRIGYNDTIQSTVTDNSIYVLDRTSTSKNTNAGTETFLLNLSERETLEKYTQNVRYVSTTTTSGSASGNLYHYGRFTMLFDYQDALEFWVKPGDVLTVPIGCVMRYITEEYAVLS
jgi:hypothetical protein